MELRTLRSFPGKWSDQFGDTMKMLHGDNLRRTYLEDECTLQLGTPRTACECTTLTQKTICLFVCCAPFFLLIRLLGITVLSLCHVLLPKL